MHLGPLKAQIATRPYAVGADVHISRLRRGPSTCLVVAALLLLLALPSAVATFGPFSLPAGPASFVADVASAAGASPALPRSTPLSVPVGEGPDALAVDPANGTLFVANQYTNNVSLVSLATNTFLGSVNVGSQPCPGCLALDGPNGTVYVANAGSNNVTAISASLGGVSATIPVGSFPDAILFNPTNKNVYVANAGSGDVTVISSVTNNRTLTVPVGLDPVALGLDTSHHNVLVAVAGSNNLTILSGVTSVPLAVVAVGNNPDAVAYDPAHNEIYVANGGSANVSVIGATNHTLLASIPVGSGPSALVVNPAKNEVFVANRFSGNVSVISTTLLTVVANLTVGAQPGTDNAMAYYPRTGALFVANSGSSNVSILTAYPAAVAGAIPVLNIPEAIALNPTSGKVYVANFGSANVSVFSVAKVTFRASGLPAGSLWSVSAGSPPVARSNTTYRASGSVVYFEPNGSFSFTVTPPVGYGLARVTGPKGTTQSMSNLSGATVTIRVLFGPLESLSINESGLPSGARWSVTVSSGYATGGAPSQNGSSNGTSIGFTVVKGPWKYSVLTRPSSYRPAHAHGAVRVGTVAAKATIPFLLVFEKVVFVESGLPPGTTWGVNVSGPMNVTLSGTGAALSVNLPNGTYTFVVSNFTALHPATGGPTHDAGSFTVVAPGLPLTERVTYSSAP